MYICTERENRERSIVALNSCKIKLNQSQSAATLEGPEKTSTYFAQCETMFLVQSEATAIKFLKRENITDDHIYIVIIGDPLKLENIHKNEDFGR